MSERTTGSVRRKSEPSRELPYPIAITLPFMVRTVSRLT